MTMTLRCFLLAVAAAIMVNSGVLATRSAPLAKVDVCPAALATLTLGPISQSYALFPAATYDSAAPLTTGRISDNFFPSARSTSGFYVFENLDSINSTQARYVTFFNNKGDQTSTDAAKVPNVTLGATFPISLSGYSPAAVVYGPSTTGVFLKGTQTNFQMQMVKSSAIYGKLIDTKIPKTATAIKAFLGYTLLALIGADTFSFARTQTLQNSGTVTTTFYLGTSTIGSTNGGAHVITADSNTFNAAIDANGLIAIVYPATGGLGVSKLQTYQLDTEVASEVTVLPIPSDSPSTIKKTYIATFSSNNYLVVIVNAANKIYAYNTYDAFTTLTQWDLVGTTIADMANPFPAIANANTNAKGAHDFALQWTSTGAVNFYEMVSPNIYARQFNFINNTYLPFYKYPNSTYGTWTDEYVLMFTAAKNFSKIRLGGITGASYNFLFNEHDPNCDATTGLCTWYPVTDVTYGRTGNLATFTCGPWVLPKASGASMDFVVASSVAAVLAAVMAVVY